MNSAKELLRPADLAPLLGVTTGRIYQLIAEGTIPAIRIGGAVRIPRNAWEGWLREKGTGAVAAARLAQQKERRRGPARSGR
jgi:excisionase family DNA binding protein